MVQETDTVPPYLYLLDNEITIPTGSFREYQFRYKLGNTAATAFDLVWFATLLDENLMVRQLMDTDRLPRATFIPPIPNLSGAADVYQNGVLRLYPSAHEAPYTSAVGSLCMVQVLTVEGDPKSNFVCPIQSQWHQHYPTWEIR